MQNSAGQIAAKFSRGGDGIQRIHPLICHMLDVAAVTDAIWQDCLAQRLRFHLARAFKLDDDSTRRWVAFLAGAHDLGKASPVFQTKGSADRRSTPPWLEGSELEFGPLNVRDPGHGTVTAAQLPAHLISRFHLSPTYANRLSLITGGHHGIFPSASLRSNATNTGLGEPRRGVDNPWARARDELIATFAELLCAEGTPDLLPNAASMLLAGLISVADWIGSIDDESFFPYALSLPNDLTAYLGQSRQRARNAVKLLHWSAWSQRGIPTSFRALFPKISHPRPLQLATEQLARKIAPPALAILEAPMGEGKTEPAFYLADFWNALGFRGSYIAMPTQATSDQLYGRLRTFLEGRYGAGDEINLQLLHGHAALNAEMKLLRTGEAIHIPKSVDQGGDDDAEATVGAAEWFTYRKRGLLAPFGVGTVDQALMSVLRVKHGFVRLFGLAGKTVVIDEVHAYDTYMSTLLERLLEWLAALGSPVILLSATLPSAKRKALVNAYLRGLGEAEAAALPSGDYPRITWTSPSGVQTLPVGTAPETRRTLQLAWLEVDTGGLPAHLLKQTREGGCAAVICNTVDRAQKVYTSLKDMSKLLPEAERPVLRLFHARSLYEDRQDCEEWCLRCFAKPGREGGITAARPSRAILVATQVIEQSLDLDFDIMISELAPLDLLLQRSGRLQRHQRADRRGAQTPALQILSPPLGDRGLPQFDRASTWVYDEHILLRTWLALRQRQAITVPEEVEDLVDTVYAESGAPPANAPEALTEYWASTLEAMETKRQGRESLANQPLIPSPHFDNEEFFETVSPELLEDRPDAARERQARTRYEELPSIGVIWLDAREAEGAKTSHPDREAIRELLMHSVQLRGRWVASLYGGELTPPSWRSNATLRHYRLLAVANGKYQVPGGPELSRDPREPDMGIVVRFTRASQTEEVQSD